MRRPTRRLLPVFGAAALVIATLTAVAPEAAAAVRPPTISSFTPTNGLSTGGTEVVVKGTNLSSAIVTFNGARAKMVEDTATRIIVSTPAGTPGLVTLRVSAPGGQADGPTPFTYDVVVPAQWSRPPNSDTNCGTWISAINVPPNVASAVVTLSGAGGGGGGYSGHGDPVGGTGGAVKATLTGQSLDSPIAVEIGCGGSPGVRKAAIVGRGGIGGSGYAPGGDGGGLAVGIGATGGGGGGASALCLGKITCTVPVVVAAGGGGAGGERDCSTRDVAGSGGSAGLGPTGTRGQFGVTGGLDGHDGDSGRGGGGGTATAGGRWARGNPIPGGPGDNTPPGSMGGTGGFGAGRPGAVPVPVSGGGGGGGGLTGGAGGGSDRCTDKGIFVTGGNAAGGGGAGSSAANKTNTTGVASGGGDARGGKSNTGTKPTATQLCPEDDARLLTTGCPGYVSLAFGISPTPTVTSLSPGSGPLAGGTPVTVTGTNFSAAAKVDFGTTRATGVTVHSSTSITATAPASAAGTVDVTVATSGGTSATSPADQFTYLPPPVVDGVSPASGPEAGGNRVVIDGGPFTDTGHVSFGGAPAHFSVDTSYQLTASAPAGTGTVDVTVTTPGGTSPAGSSDEYTYVPVPTVNGVNPARGSTLGGTPVIVTGTGFAHATTVLFGTAPSKSFTIASDTSLTTVAPAGSPGVVDLRVRTASGTSPTSSADRFTYLAPPTVSSVDPNGGPAAGGTSVTITGGGFTGATGVEFGDNAASDLVVHSSSDITVDSPPGVGGTTVDVTVTGPGGTSATGHGDHFTYQPEPSPPQVHVVNPHIGPPAGGTPVTIAGTGLTDPQEVLFGGVPATGVVGVSDTEITATAPAGSGTVDVQVATPVGLSPIGDADHYTYIPRPTVSSVRPDAGPATGGTVVTVTGSGLGGTTAVDFGGVAGTGLVVLSGSELTIHSPAGSGMVHVTVTTPGGTSETSTADQFTYLPAPKVTGVVPPEGAESGGGIVAVYGTGFYHVSSVMFGTRPGTGVTPLDPDLLTVRVPTGTGTVTVTVATPGGTSAHGPAARFAYLPAPTVTGLSQSAGPEPGGGTIIVKGTGFTGAATTFFGTSPAVFSVDSDTRITATIPAGRGTVSVTVTTAGGSSATGGAGRYTYFPVPTVTRVTPNSGPTSGGPTVTIRGSGFIGPTLVSFDGAMAAGAQVISPTQLLARVPPGDQGTVHVSVVTPGGFSSVSSGDEFTYLQPSGYREVASDGGIFSFGDAVFYGSMGGHHLNQPIVGMATTPDGGGYWLVASDGGIFSFGDAVFYGSMGGHHLNAAIVGMATTPDGGGYWEVASDGGIFSFGDAVFYGSMGGHHLNAAIVGIAATPDGGGYWEVASDGGIFSFGGATFYGSMGGHHLNQPIVGMAATPDGGGYWLVASDGGIFSFGDATFHGSMGGHHLNQPIVGMAATADGGGYWLVASDGGIFSFGDATFHGSMGGHHLNQPIVGMATDPDPLAD